MNERPVSGRIPALSAEQQLALMLGQARLSREQVVVDLGSADGFLTLPAARHARRVIAVDFPVDAIAVAELPAVRNEVLDLQQAVRLIGARQERVAARARQKRAAGWLGNIDLLTALPEDLPLAAAAHDVVLTRLTMHHFMDPLPPIKEMHRVLKPGGRLVLVDITAAPEPDRAALHNRLEQHRTPSHVRFYAPDDLAALVRTAGFELRGMARWTTPRLFSEWVGAASFSAGEAASLKKMLAATAADDSAGLGVGRTPDGDLSFSNNWVAVVAEKPLRSGGRNNPLP